MTTQHATPQTIAPQAPAEETIVLLQRTVRDALMQRHAFPEPLATEWAEAIVTAIRQEHGGEPIYIKAPSRAERDEAIRRDIRPGNAAQLASRHGISVAMVYRIAGTYAPKEAA